MKIVITMKNDEKKTFEKVWIIQSNNLSNGKELMLVGYDHTIKFKGYSDSIKSFITEFEN